ncbi:hypothetical protein [Microbacterium sp. A93]|uniref:hypothetical protein n=1 Tax=Microbacterium sp. A93 TaxID=3450716 RepID=UPI003F4210C4
MPAEPRTNDLLRPQSPAVYRRRRLVAVVLLLVVLVLLVGLVWWLASLFRPAPDEAGAAPTASASQSASPAATDSGGTPSGSASSSASPSASDSASSSPTADAAAAGDCPPGDIVVSAATDQPTYTDGEDPVLELRVDNTGQEPCEANLGTSQQVFTVYSGSDRIFSTEGCQEGEDAMVEISPDEQERARLTWPRVRTGPDCAKIDSDPRSGTYRLEVSLGELKAQPVSFNLQ